MEIIAKKKRALDYIKSVEEECGLKLIMDREYELSEAILDEFFDNHDDREGVYKEELGGGWTLRADFKKSWKIDNKVIAGVMAELSNMPSVKPDDIFPRVWKFAKRGYNDLHDSIKVVADKALIVKPGKRSVEIVPPKEDM